MNTNPSLSRNTVIPKAYNYLCKYISLLRPTETRQEIPLSRCLTTASPHPKLIIYVCNMDRRHVRIQYHNQSLWPTSSPHLSDKTTSHLISSRTSFLPVRSQLVSFPD